ncbi:phage virion morphogenesis protein [Candidatus Pacearchaeota archaeon]|nr:phage virion morphogenesis protein [Candidatus Pacearchaeota archaeon]
MGEFKQTIKFDQYIPDLRDADKEMFDIAQKIANDAQRNIRRQTSPDGTPFTPLDPKTVRKKRRRGAQFSRRALYDRGVMYRSIKVFKIAKNRYGVQVQARGKPRRDLVALIHQEGTPTIPARPFMGISGKTRDWINARMQRWLNSKLAKSQHRVILLK